MVWEDPSHPRRLVEWLPACGCTWGADFNPATTSTWNNSRRAVRSPTVITRLIKFNEAVHLRVFFSERFVETPIRWMLRIIGKLKKHYVFVCFFFLRSNPWTELICWPLWNHALTCWPFRNCRAIDYVSSSASPAEPSAPSTRPRPTTFRSTTLHRPPNAAWWPLNTCPTPPIKTGAALHFKLFFKKLNRVPPVGLVSTKIQFHFLWWQIWILPRSEAVGSSGRPAPVARVGRVHQRRTVLRHSRVSGTRRSEPVPQIAPLPAGSTFRTLPAVQRQSR